MFALGLTTCHTSYRFRLRLHPPPGDLIWLHQHNHLLPDFHLSKLILLGGFTILCRMCETALFRCCFMWKRGRIMFGDHNWRTSPSGLRWMTHEARVWWHANQRTNTESAKYPSLRTNWKRSDFCSRLSGERGLHLERRLNESTRPSDEGNRSANWNLRKSILLFDRKRTVVLTGHRSFGHSGVIKRNGIEPGWKWPIKDNSLRLRLRWLDIKTDTVSLITCDGYHYLLTCDVWFGRWSVIVPVTGMPAEMVVRSLLRQISSFGIPSTIAPGLCFRHVGPFPLKWPPASHFAMGI